MVTVGKIEVSSAVHPLTSKIIASSSAAPKVSESTVVQPLDTVKSADAKPAFATFSEKVIEIWSTSASQSSKVYAVKIDGAAPSTEVTVQLSISFHAKSV